LFYFGKVLNLFNFHKEPWHTPQGALIREVVFGMNDGLISIVGFIAGASGAIADNRIILLAALAAMVAGTLSMAFGGYLSSKSQVEFFKKEIAREKREIDEYPENEKQELFEIFGSKGFTPEEVNMIVNRVTKDKKQWLDVMMKEELGLVQEKFDNPWKIAGVMGISFFSGGIVPIIPYFFIKTGNPLGFSIALSLLALFGLGAGKARLANRKMWVGGVEILVIGSVCAIIGYFLGSLFSGIPGF